RLGRLTFRGGTGRSPRTAASVRASVPRAPGSLARGIPWLFAATMLGGMVVRPTPHLRLLPEDAPLPPAAPELVDSYRRLADVFHESLAENSPDTLLVPIRHGLRA